MFSENLHIIRTPDVSHVRSGQPDTAQDYLRITCLDRGEVERRERRDLEKEHGINDSIRVRNGYQQET